MNSIFPNWIDANDVLKQVVKDSFDFYVEFDFQDSTCLDVGFLKQTELNYSECIPNEHLDTFVAIYNRFMNDFCIKVKINDIFKKYQFERANKTTIAMLKSDCLYAIKIYEMEKDIKLSDIFLHKYLGIDNWRHQMINKSFEKILRENTREEFEQKYWLDKSNDCSLISRDGSVSIECPWIKDCDLNDDCKRCWKNTIGSSRFKDERIFWNG
jgi:hypothetical protein